MRIPFEEFSFFYTKESKNWEVLGNIKGEFLRRILYDKSKVKETSELRIE